jgi:hypothetical protein
MLANLRHPNIVWVFGLVLPTCTAQETLEAGGSSGDAAGGSSGGGGVGGDVVGLATLMANRWGGAVGVGRGRLI